MKAALTLTLLWTQSENGQSGCAFFNCSDSANLKIDGLTKPGSVVVGTRAMEGQKVNEKKTDISDRPWDLRQIRRDLRI